MSWAVDAHFDHEIIRWDSKMDSVETLNIKHTFRGQARFWMSYIPVLDFFLNHSIKFIVIHLNKYGCKDSLESYLKNTTVNISAV